MKDSQKDFGLVGDAPQFEWVETGGCAPAVQMSVRADKAAEGAAMAVDRELYAPKKQDPSWPAKHFLGDPVPLVSLKKTTHRDGSVRFDPLGMDTVRVDPRPLWVIPEGRDVDYKCKFVTQAPQSGAMKNTNPKDVIGNDKVPFHLCPMTAVVAIALANTEGASKYGQHNYRAMGVRASIYYDAGLRHLNAWYEGEDTDPDSGLPHLWKAAACLAILIDATESKMLNDDRAYPSGYLEMMKKATPHVARLRAMHAEKTPHHFTIQDVKQPGVAAG